MNVSITTNDIGLLDDRLLSDFIQNFPNFTEPRKEVAQRSGLFESWLGDCHPNVTRLLSDILIHKNYRRYFLFFEFCRTFEKECLTIGPDAGRETSFECQTTAKCQY